MPIRSDLMREIRNALAGALTPNLTARSQGADLYEAYVWSLVIEGARSEGAIISFWDVHGNRVASSFTFRTSPGNIFSTSNPYCYAQISFPNCPDLEAHLGIFVAGQSGVPHECDVAVILAD